ncbi:MAG TPA: 7TM diverse intracellular signaling domain-containing protein [Oligoflexus sp.]|uniref:7TM diverse intracellular signaling domain-containing protein n=1 Tax=Oligoflexus sp. TaxID=1971216 RepID=UPI002D7100B2|nr:7TM diverse intracellular signaling domain-containing protein [Oligoflexus sp.]HYX31527.1 7TM diverse intracellular signaling domain-containing protein [Oligoflexus sp.]
MVRALTHHWNRKWRSCLVQVIAAMVWFHVSPLHGAAINGVLDLGTTSWQTPVALDGEWHFYPEVFLRETDIQSEGFGKVAPLKIPIPGGLSQLADQYKNPRGEGRWGTLVLEIRNMKAPFENVGLHLRGDTAYQVFVLDLDRPGPMRSLVTVGKPSARRENSIPQVASPLGLWNGSGSGHYLLLVHLSGHYYTDTNLWTSPHLGSYEALKHELDLVFLLDALVAGGMFIMSLYYLSFYFHRREDKAALLLGVWSSAVFLRHFSCSPQIQMVLFPESSVTFFSAIRAMEFGLLGVMGGTASWFAIESFELKNLRTLGKIHTALGLVILVFCVLTGPAVYPNFILFINLILVVQVATYLYAALQALKIKAKGSLYLTIGGAITAMSVVYDMSIGMGYRSSPLFITPIGMTLLLFANGQLVAKLFAHAFRTAQRLSVSLQEEVEKKTLRLRSMLDNIPQGVVSIIPPGIADSEYSRHLEIILGTNAITHQPIESLLLDPMSLSSDEKDRIMATLAASLGEDVLNFEINASQLVTEVEFQRDGKHRSLQVSWVPIANSRSIVEGIQVTLNDVTALRDIERESQDQKEELSYIQEILPIHVENFRVFMDSSLHLLQENVRLIGCNKDGLDDVGKILFINLHTIKGSARTLGLKKITSLVHDVEHGYVDLLKNIHENWNQSVLLAQIESIQAMLDHYQHIFHQVLGRNKTRSDEIGVSREFLEQHCHLLSKLSTSINQPSLHSKLLNSLKVLEQEVFQDATEFLQDFLGAAERIARDLGKEHPLILVDADEFILSHDAKNALGKSIIHVLRNAMDHGIEPANERMEKGKAPFGCIKFQLDEHDQQLHILIEDDGRGLAVQELKARAGQAGLGQVLTPQTIADLIFQPGLSTAASITEISGRGMGMDAVRKFIREVGGDVQVRVDENQPLQHSLPFKILIMLPNRFYRRKKRDEVHLAAG